MIDDAFQTYITRLSDSDTDQFAQGLGHWRKRVRAQIEQLALLCFKKRQFSESKELYEAFFCFKKKAHLHHLLNYSQCLKQLGLQQKQIRFLQQQCTKQPDCFQLWFALGNAQKNSGLLLEAQQSYSKALAINPRHTDLLYSSTSLSGFSSLSSESLEHLNSVLSDPSQQPNQKSLAAFMLGQRWIEAQELAKGFELIQLANQLHLQTNPLRLQFDADHLHKLSKYFNREFFTQWSATTSSKQRLNNQQIFIIGMSRSGKTLIENILCLSPELKPEQESMALVRFVRRHLQNRPKGNLDAFINRLDNDKVTELQADYNQSFASTAKATSYTMPWNVTDLGYVGLLNPEAKIIFITRDYRDLGLACFSKLYAQGNSYASDLVALGKQIALYERLIQHWQKNLPNPCLTLSYESLVRNPSQGAQQLFHFCQLQPPNQSLDQALAQAAEIDGNFSQSQDFLTQITDRHIGMSSDFLPWLEPMITSYHNS